MATGHSGARHAWYSGEDGEAFPGRSFWAFRRHSYNKIVPKAKELESRLQRTEQQLQLFQKVSRFMVRDLSLQEVLQGIVSLTVEFSQCDSCLVYLLDNEELVLCASNTPHPSTIGKVRLKLNEGLTGWVARERRLLAISREAYKDPRFKTFGELPEDSYEAFLSAPVIARNRVVGVINVQHRHAASAYRRRDGSADHAGRTGRLRAGAGAHGAYGGGIGESCGAGVVFRPDSPAIDGMENGSFTHEIGAVALVLALLAGPA